MTAAPSLPSLGGRAAVVHTITYMLMGVLASTMRDHAALFARADMACWMRPLSGERAHAIPRDLSAQRLHT